MGFDKERSTGFERRSAPESAMRPVAIVLFDPASDAKLGRIEVLIFVEPHLLFF